MYHKMLSGKTFCIICIILEILNNRLFIPLIRHVKKDGFNRVDPFSDKFLILANKPRVKRCCSLLFEVIQGNVLRLT